MVSVHSGRKGWRCEGKWVKYNYTSKVRKWVMGENEIEESLGANQGSEIAIFLSI